MKHFYTFHRSTKQPPTSQRTIGTTFNSAKSIPLSLLKFSLQHTPTPISSIWLSTCILYSDTYTSMNFSYEIFLNAFLCTYVFPDNNSILKAFLEPNSWRSIFLLIPVLYVLYLQNDITVRDPRQRSGNAS
jgi:hypothetical protein